MAVDNVGKSYKEYALLGDKYGFVYLEGTLPDPLRNLSLDDWVIRGARISYRSVSKSPEADLGLIRRLLTHEHMSPFEQPQVTYSLRMPGAVVTHILRHRTFHLNGESGRFTVVKDELYKPQWRKQSLTNKQVADILVGGEQSKAFTEAQAKLYEVAKEQYDIMLSQNVGREIARMVLPSDALYKSYVITADLRNLLGFFKLRCASDAQWETRQFACAMYWLIAPMAPFTTTAWLEGISEDVKKNLTKWKEEHGEPS